MVPDIYIPVLWVLHLQFDCRLLDTVYIAGNFRGVKIRYFVVKLTSTKF